VHEVPNLFVSDGSVFTTGGACNPTLTIVALAIRQADHLAEQLSQRVI
jgi:choline dehydrogenase-like flavoprotein